jgi:hypothetical protein
MRTTASLLLAAAAVTAPVALALSNSKLSIHTGLGSVSWDFIKQAQPVRVICETWPPHPPPPTRDTGHARTFVSQDCWVHKEGTLYVSVCPGVEKWGLSREPQTRIVELLCSQGCVGRLRVPNGPATWMVEGGPHACPLAPSDLTHDPQQHAHPPLLPASVW